jgi:hypothetical protein
MDYKTFGANGLKWIDSGGRANRCAAFLTERGKTFVLRQAESAGDSVIIVGD